MNPVQQVFTEIAMAAKQGKAEKPHPERAKLVVIDDDQNLLQVLKEGLDANYEVHCASEPQEGLRLVEHLVPSVVLLDVAMPGMDGFAICEAIREASWVRHIPVIFLTAHGGDSFAMNARKAGGDAFLTKPFSFADLIANIERLRKEHGSAK